MTKALLVALRCLPRRFLRDGTSALEYGPEPGCVVAIHGNHAPICYYPSRKRWFRIKFDRTPTTISGEGFTRPANLLTIKPPASLDMSRAVISRGGHITFPK